MGVLPRAGPHYAEGPRTGLKRAHAANPMKGEGGEVSHTQAPTEEEH